MSALKPGKDEITSCPLNAATAERYMRSGSQTAQNCPTTPAKVARFVVGFSEKVAKLTLVSSLPALS